MNRKRIITISIILGILLLIILGWYLYGQRRDRITREQEFNTRVALEEYSQAFAEENPLISYLPYEADDFEVHYGVRDEEDMSAFYLIVIKMDSIPDDIELFDQRYYVSLDRAYDWIRDRGFNPDDLDIEIEVETPDSN